MIYLAATLIVAYVGFRILLLLIFFIAEMLGL
jgi:hypothetical protein